MARIRTVKPDLWQDEAIGEISVEARLTFLGLITQADDFGRLKGAPKLVRSWVFPYDDYTVAEVSGWLRELSGKGLIHWFKVDGKDFIELPSWSKHQRVSHPTDSALPSHTEADSADPPERLRNPPEDVYREGKGREGIGKDKEGRTGKPASRSLFPEWLDHYRETTGRTSVTGSKPAREAFAARIKDGKTLDELKLATVGCHGDQFCRENGHDVPETILRASKVERYISLARDRGSKKATSVDQAHHFAQMARDAEAEERAAA